MGCKDIDMYIYILIHSPQWLPEENQLGISFTIMKKVKLFL